jgi:hypothetical protein
VTSGPQAITPRVEVRDSPLGKGVFAVEAIPAGACVLELPPVFEESPGRHTLQVGERRHQSFTGDADDFVNHSCKPTCCLDAGSLRLMALTAVAAGQEVTLNYLATEWELVEPFVCACDGRERLIRGYRHLSPEERSELGPFVAPWLRAWEGSGRSPTG